MLELNPTLLVISSLGTFTQSTTQSAISVGSPSMKPTYEKKDYLKVIVYFIY